MALTVSTDAIIEKLSGTAGADSQVHSITSGQIIVCVGGKVVDGGTKQFTVKVMHPDATAAHAVTMMLGRSSSSRRYGAPRRKRKKPTTKTPREGWENGTPPPHRDFKERSVMR